MFGVVFLAELPDKTALTALVLATRQKPLPVFVGASLALTTQSIVAVTAGGLIGLLPARPVHIGAGLLFLGCALVMWRKKVEESDLKDSSGTDDNFLRVMSLAFTVVFLAEWGDLTQLATVALTARSKAPLTVFAGAVAAFWCVTGIAVLVGHRAGKLLNPNVMKNVAAAVFALVGLALLVGLL